MIDEDELLCHIAAGVDLPTAVAASETQSEQDKQNDRETARLAVVLLLTIFAHYLCSLSLLTIFAHYLCSFCCSLP
jgi:hypothetical protein